MLTKKRINMLSMNKIKQNQSNLIVVIDMNATVYARFIFVKKEEKPQVLYWVLVLAYLQ